MKKNLVTSLTVIAALLGTGVMAPATANASTWHNGTPKALRGTWKASKKDGSVLVITKTHASYQGKGGDLGKIKYRVNHKKSYVLKTTYGKLNVKLINKTHLKTASYNSGKTVTYHK